MRVTLLADCFGELAALEARGVPEAKSAGLFPKGWGSAAYPNGKARHALVRRGLLTVGDPVFAPRTATKWYTPRAVTELGNQVAEYGVRLLQGSGDSKAPEQYMQQLEASR